MTGVAMCRLAFAAMASATVAAGARADAGATSRFDAMVQRPLFSPTRRPPPTPVVAEPTAPLPPPALPPAPPPDLALSGIIAGGGGGLALVRRPQDAAPIRVVVGGQIDGWTVAEIHPRSILLRRDARSVTVELSAGSR